MDTSTISELPPLTHKAMRDFLPLRLIQALTFALFSITFGGISTMVYVSNIGPFYGAGYLSYLFLFGLPLGFLGLILPYTMPSLSGWWLRTILALSLIGTLLSIVGAVNVVSTMMNLVP